MTTTALAHLPAFLGFNTAGNAPLAAALNALPGHREHATAQATLQGALDNATADLATAQAARADLTRRALGALLADASLPPDLTAQAIECHGTITRAEATLAALKDVSTGLAVEVDSALRTAPDALLRHLDEQLQEALIQARGLDLRGATDADEAIDAGSTTAWAQFTALRTTAFYIREAQRTVMVNLVHDHALTQHADTFGWVRNYADLFPQWFNKQLRIPERTLNGEPVDFQPPWPGDPAGFWMYAVTHPDVDLWVPTPTQLHAAYTDAHTEARRTKDAEDAGEDATREQREHLHRKALVRRRYPKILA